MKHEYVMVQNAVSPKQLFLLFHGVGDNPVSMGEIGRYFAEAFPQALVVSIGGPESSGVGNGRQWFSIQGITEENRVERINTIMPRFIDTVRYWQEYSQVDYAHTALIGFSQGSIMILEALKAEENLAGRVVIFSGRFAALPEQPFTETVVHLIHGEDDPVIAVDHVRTAAHRLRSHGSDFTLDLVPELGHAIDDEMMGYALDRLKNYIPQRYWDEAVQGNRGELIAFR
ncbi:esterase [Pectobacteriaceae bacterium CE70]|uniref:esterase n=1 Tax=Brenneria uluponensis TaxID=3057057 RepID=UPI0028F1374D|nr:esterase [Brenneria ulupoensis]WJV63750.1 esterase [Pectobacteriaceae bacterium C52]WJV68145.1 esterase [Pectobacteriaceae bacterium CE70]WJY12084.1 esterase [Pectobacteriaceae bacterium C80]